MQIRTNYPGALLLFLAFPGKEELAIVYLTAIATAMHAWLQMPDGLHMRVDDLHAVRTLLEEKEGFDIILGC